MNDDERERLIVLAGQELRLDTLAKQVDQARAAVAETDPAREAADRLLGTPSPFDGDPDAVRRSADGVLGVDLAHGHALSAAELEWDKIVDQNRRALTEAGADPDRIGIEDVADEASLARIDAEWATFASELDVRLDDQATAALIASARRAVITAIVRPLGLDGLFARLDRDGGAVLTPHNAEAARRGDLDAGGLADPHHAAEYARRRDATYRHDDYEGGLAEMRKTRFNDPVPLRDAYAPERDLPRDGRAHIDHVIAARRLHDDRDVNFFLTLEEKRALVNAEPNLAFTHAPLNQSKGDKPLSEFMDRTRKDGTRNAEYFGMDREASLNRERVAEEHRDAVVDGRAASYYARNTTAAAARGAAAIGLQQAIGVALVELSVGLFDEVRDLWRGGRERDALIDDLLLRARRVGERVLASWREVAGAFVGGALVGAMSTILTTIINTVTTTARRVVRVLRDGIVAVARALKMLVAPPPGLDGAEAAHQASVLLATAVAASAGIVAEEAVEKALIAAAPILAPVAPVLATAGVGLATGLAAVLLVALLERVDFFGAVARERGERRLAAMRERTERLLDELLTAAEPERSATT